MNLSLPPNLTEILHDQLYIGNLSAALSERYRQSAGITHILSACPDYPSTDVTHHHHHHHHHHHLVLNVQDSEYEDLLIHLPRTCEFIEKALSTGGRVLVHCVMGISRSTTVAAAYLMKSRGMDAMSAIQFIKKARPQAHPNYGFITQLVTFGACKYDPSPSDPVYRAWKRKQKQHVTAYLNHLSDSTAIIPDKLLLSSGFPEDPTQAEWLIQDLGITHLLTLSPCKIPPTLRASTTLAQYKHINVSDQRKGDLLVELPTAVKFISRAVGEGGMVLVHCLLESRACTAVCASLMEMRNMSPKEAFDVIEDALPLFNATRNFSRHLELFAACGYNPTREHYLVQDWIRSQTVDPYSCTRPALSSSSSLNFSPPSSCGSKTQAQHAPSFSRSPSLVVTSGGSSAVSSPAPSTPASSRTSSASSPGGPGPLAGVYPHVPGKDSALGDEGEGEGNEAGCAYPCGYRGDRGYLVAKAMEVLGGCDSSDDEGDGDRVKRFDLSAFGRTLVAIQEREGGR